MDKKSTFNREQYVQILHNCNMRATIERLAIFDAAMIQTRPFSIEDLNAALAESGFHVSKATIYNNVNLMVETEILRRLISPDSTSTLFEKATNASHMRLSCLNCGKVRELRSSELQQHIKMQQFKTFAPRHFVLTIYGLCRKCERNLKTQQITKFK